MFRCFVVVLLTLASVASGSQQNETPKKTLRIVTLHVEPFMMNNTEDPQATGNDRYVGFLKDLIEEIADVAGFNYSLYPAPDGKFGTFNNATQKWTGMIGELETGKADMAANALTISAARHYSFDFTKPFLFTGLSVLYKHPTYESVNEGSAAFLAPFSSGAWLSLLGMYVFTSLALWFVARCSPSERKRLDADGNPAFTIYNAFWLTGSSLLLRGSELHPKSLATRMILFFWWVFSMVFMVLYALLVARETITVQDIPRVSHWKDLLNQKEIEYGSVKGGSTYAYFRDSQVPDIRRLGEAMTSNPSVLVPNTSEGIARVEASNGRYAFFMETVSADYGIQRNCNLTKLGPELQQRSYGFALAKGSEWTHPISVAILKLQEQGAVQALYDKWWRGTQSENCAKFEPGEKVLFSLDAHNTRGFFIGLTICIFVALAVAVFEVVWFAIWSTDFSKPLPLRLLSEMKEIIGAETAAGTVERERFSEST